MPVPLLLVNLLTHSLTHLLTHSLTHSLLGSGRCLLEVGKGRKRKGSRASGVGLDLSVFEGRKGERKEERKGEWKDTRSLAPRVCGCWY